MTFSTNQQVGHLAQPTFDFLLTKLLKKYICKKTLGLIICYTWFEYFGQLEINIFIYSIFFNG